MQFLVMMQWLREEASAKHLAVTPAEVRAELAKREAQDKPGEFRRLLARSGQSTADAELRLETSLIQQKLEAQALAPTKRPATTAEVRQYYDTHRSNFGHAQERSVHLVVTKHEAEAQQAKRELEAHQSWAWVAKSLASVSLLRRDGGIAHGLTLTPQTRTVTGPIFAAKEHVLEGPVKTDIGYTVFEVLGVTPPAYKPLAMVEKRARKELEEARRIEALSEFHKAMEAKWQPKTRCRRGYIIPLCGNSKGAAPSGGGTSGTAG